MKKVIITISLLLAVSISSCDNKNIKSNLYAKDKSQSSRGRAKGFATIFDDDRALNDARNKLVEDVLGATVSGRSIVKDFKLVSKIIEAKSYGLIKKEKVIDEGDNGNLYHIEIEGTVKTAVVQDVIENALNRYGRPKFMVLIKESFEGKTNYPGAANNLTESKILDIMQDLNFEFIDAEMTQELMQSQKSRMNNASKGRINEDVQNLLLSNKIGAEVIIIGIAVTIPQKMKYRNWKSRAATVRLKAIDVYTGRILSAMDKSAPASHINPLDASSNAIELAIKKLLGKRKRILAGQLYQGLL